MYTDSLEDDSGDITHTFLGTPAVGASSAFSAYMPGILTRLLHGRHWRTYDPDDYLIEGDILDWTYSSGLFRPDEYASLQAYSMPMLANIWCLHEDPVVVDLIVRSMVWISALDDKLGELGRPLSAYATACGQAMRTGEVPADANLYHHTVVDLRNQIMAAGAAAVIPELADSMDEFMRAVQTEIRWRTTGRWPTIGQYLANRQVTIGGLPSALLLRLKPGVIRPGVPISTSLAQLRWLVLRLVGVENDLVSSHKEDRDGTGNTFLRVIETAYDVDAPRAILCGLAIDAALRDQHDQLADAILHDPAEPPEAKRYAEILATWVDGQTNYELSAPRYGMADFLSAVSPSS
jgi:hypothetical protein